VDREAEQLGSERARLARREIPSPEVLGRDGRVWTPPRWARWVLAVVVVVGGVAWYGDHRARAHEEHALASCQRRLDDASALSDRRLNAMADYLRPALGVVGGHRRATLSALMESPARIALADVERADRDCRAVRIARWHPTLAARQRAVVAYSGALVDHVRSVADDGASYFRPDAALARLRTAAGLS
jgi:hypothetical protein